MLTEKNTIKTQTELKSSTLVELNAKQKKMCILFIVIGTIGGITFLALYIADVLPDYGACFFALFGLGTFFAVFGGFMLRILKKASKAPDVKTVFECEIYAEGIAAKKREDGKVTHASLYYNSKMVRTLETADYFFLYVDQASVLPINKSDLSPAETDYIKSVYLKQYVSTADRLNLAPFEPGTPDFVQSQDTDTPNASC